MATQKITGIQTIKSPDTPWSYTSDPGYLEGPWQTVEEALGFMADTGAQVNVYWLRGDTLWVACL